MNRKIRVRTLERDMIMDAIISAGGKLQAINKLSSFLLYTLDKNNLDKETTRQLEILNDMYHTDLFHQSQPPLK